MKLYKSYKIIRLATKDNFVQINKNSTSITAITTELSDILFPEKHCSQ